MTEQQQRKQDQLCNAETLHSYWQNGNYLLFLLDRKRNVFNFVHSWGLFSFEVHFLLEINAGPVLFSLIKKRQNLSSENTAPNFTSALISTEINFAAKSLSRETVTKRKSFLGKRYFDFSISDGVDCKESNVTV